MSSAKSPLQPKDVTLALAEVLKASGRSTKATRQPKPPKDPGAETPTLERDKP